MTCLNCTICEYENEWGCLYRDYDCFDGCGECMGTDVCKYEGGELEEE